MKLVIPPPLQGLIVAAVMWAVHSWAPGFAVDVPGRKAAAISVGAIGVAMEIAAIITFFRARTTVNPLKPANASRIVSTGLFRLSRNPMYLALLLVLIGWGLWLGNLLGAVLIALWVLYITEFQIKPEEQALREKFGAEYEDYCRRTRRWI